MRSRGLALAAVALLAAACAEKAPPPAPTAAPAPPATAPAPPPPARRPPPPPPVAQPPAQPQPAPRTVTPAPAPPPAAGAPSPAPSERATGSPAAAAVLYIGVQRANFREGPDVRAKILAVLTKGTKLTVLEKGSQWYRVRLEDGKEGWVAESVTAASPD